MKGVISMVLGGIVLFVGIGLATAYSLLWLTISGLGLLMIFTPMLLETQRRNRILKSKEVEALEKFGNIKPKDDSICSVCHQPNGQHYFPYECPKNAFYNYKTNQFNLLEDKK